MRGERVVGELEGDAAIFQACTDVLQLLADDAAQVFARQRLEDDDLAQAIEELRTEVRAYGFEHGFFRAFAKFAAAGDAVE